MNGRGNFLSVILSLSRHQFGVSLASVDDAALIMHIQLHPTAKLDLQRHIEYLESAGIVDERLREFTAVIQEAFAKIEQNPMTWSFAPGSRRVRKVQIRQFRLQVFYVLRTNKAPLILEVAGPGVQPRWRGRL
jgi:hypothetical protein